MLEAIVYEGLDVAEIYLGKQGELEIGRTLLITADRKNHSSKSTKADRHSTSIPHYLFNHCSQAVYVTSGAWDTSVRELDQPSSTFISLPTNLVRAHRLVNFQLLFRRCFAREAPQPRRPRGASSPPSWKYPCNTVYRYCIFKLLGFLGLGHLSYHWKFARSWSGLPPFVASLPISERRTTFWRSSPAQHPPLSQYREILGHHRRI